MVYINTIQLQYNYNFGRTRLKNMLFCRHLGRFIRVHPAGQKKNYHFEMEKIALIRIYNTFVTQNFFFKNVHQKKKLTRMFLVDPVG